MNTIGFVVFTVLALLALAVSAVTGALALAIAKARRTEPPAAPVPASFVREAERTTDEDWEPAVPLR